MTADFDGIKLRIPNGYVETDVSGCYMNGHGVEYALVKYGHEPDAAYCLETIYSKHVRQVWLEKVN